MLNSKVVTSLQQSLEPIHKNLLLPSLPPVSPATNEPHSFAGLKNMIALLQPVRGIIALAEAIPVLESASVCDSLKLSPSDGNIFDVLSWKKDVAAVDAMDRNFGCRDAALREFANRLRDNDNIKTQGLRHAMSDFFGFRLKPDYNAITIAYLKRIQIGMAHIDEHIGKACRLAFAVHTEAMINALAGSLSATFPKPFREIPQLNLNLSLSWEVRIESTGHPLNMRQHRKEFENSFRDYYGLNLQWCREIAGSLVE